MIIRRRISRSRRLVLLSWPSIFVLAFAVLCVAQESSDDSDLGQTGDTKAQGEELAAEEARRSLEAAELAFAASARARDRERFRSFLDPEVVFAGGGAVLRGPDAVLAGWDAFFRRDGPTIEWRPENVEVAGDGLLGMTRGPYSVRTESADGSVREDRGTFVSTWRRTTADEAWKIVLDTGVPAQSCP